MLLRRAFLTFALLVAACGKQPAEGPEDVAVGAPQAGGAAAEPPPPPPPPARDAQDLAVRLSGARSAALFHTKAWRGHPALRELGGWMPLRGALERAKIDPTEDIDRVLLAAADPKQWMGLTVFEHHIDEARLATFLLEGAKTSEPVGAPLRSGNMVGARMNLPVEYRGRKQTLSGDVWLPTPSLIVVVPPDTKGVEVFARSGGLPLPTKDEGASGWALEPDEVFDNPHVRIPESLSRADAWAFPRPGGALHLDVRARSTSHDQALSDANRLTGSLDRATSVKLGPLTVKVFQTPVFRAEGDEVVAEMDLTRAQVDQLLTLAGSQRPRY